MSKFNENEWYSAVYMAKSCLELTPRPTFGITESDLKVAAHDFLNGLIARLEGRAPTLSEKTREIVSLLNSEAVMEIAKNGGGLQ
ncbi:MAG: hypothetical protein KA997_04105 [Moraxellaceae bacterium]|nr:hypothetical protein [Moraxellaceae bacterium]